MRKILYIFGLSIIILLLQNSNTYAADFTVESSFDIYLENMEDTIVKVEEILKIQANNPQFYIPTNTEQTITIPTLRSDSIDDNIKLKKDSLKVTGHNNNPLDYEVTQQNNTIIVKTQNTSEISTNKPFFMKVSYKTNELVNQNGNITNLYLPGLHKDTILEKTEQTHNLKTTYTYNMSYNIPIDAPEPAYISPTTIIEKENQKYREYLFPQEERIGNTGWVQLGSEQYYYFKISQHIPKTDTFTPEKLSEITSWTSTNIVEITLPKKFEETNQQVFITNINTDIKRIRTDEENNVIAIFEIPANRAHQIEIEGYITLSKNIKDIPNINIDEYIKQVENLHRLEVYTQDDKYWESNHESIQEIAKEIQEKHANSNILEIIRASYNFVINELEYSQEKATGENPRIGALRALRGEPAVCMEYADLLIAILRAQGIPTKAAVGYGNEPNKEDRTNLAADSGHQWVQVWIPKYGWLSVDPTWGETSREYIGGDLDHVLWYTISNSEQKVSEIMIKSANVKRIDILDNYEVIVKPIHERDMPNLEDSENLNSLITVYAQADSEPSEFETILKTTTLGRAIIFTVPVITTFLIIMGISITISKIIKIRRT